MKLLKYGSIGLIFVSLVIFISTKIMRIGIFVGSADGLPFFDIVTYLTTVLGIIGFFSSLFLSWKKEGREKLGAEKLRLEIEKIKLEILKLENELGLKERKSNE